MLRKRITFPWLAGALLATDGGKSWEKVLYVDDRTGVIDIAMHPNDPETLLVATWERQRDGFDSWPGSEPKPDGYDGYDPIKKWGKGSRQIHADQHALWINPNDGRHLIVGTDGGFYVSHDRAQNWDHLNHVAMGQFYHVAVDNRKPYRVYGGLQDNGSWAGPSMSLAGPGIINEDYVVVGGGDGFVCRVDPTDPDLVYFESQDGVMARRNLRTGEFAPIRPRAERSQGPPPGAPAPC